MPEGSCSFLSVGLPSLQRLPAGSQTPGQRWRRFLSSGRARSGWASSRQALWASSSGDTPSPSGEAGVLSILAFLHTVRTPCRRHRPYAMGLRSRRSAHRPPSRASSRDNRRRKAWAPSHFRGAEIAGDMRSADGGVPPRPSSFRIEVLTCCEARDKPSSRSTS